MAAALAAQSNYTQRWTQGKQEEVITVLRLPPRLFAVRLKGGDDVLDAVVDGVVHGVVGSAGVAVEALLLILRQEHRGS